MRRVLAMFALASATTLTALARQQTPVFKSGVDLLTVQLSVLDKDGRPVRDLQAFRLQRDRER